MDNAVIYARYSSSGQRDESIEGQLRDCHDFAERYGLNVIGEYCDKALTGTTDKRPEFQRMIRDSSKGNFSVVITWKNDRFARSRYDSAIYKYKLKQNGVRIFYAKESIPDGPEGIILESVMEGYAEYYSANLSQNVKRGIYDSALKRQTLGQQVYGLQKGADGRWEHNPSEAPIVKRIFEQYAAGVSSKDIYEGLNASGYRTSRGGLFNKSSVRRILQNEKYCGVYKYADIRDEEGIPPIVSKELFRKVTKMLEFRHNKPAAKKNEEGGYILTGKLFCGHCESPMTAASGTSKTGRVYNYYMCNNARTKKCDKKRVPKEWIEDLIVRKLADIANDDVIINEFADRFMEWQKKQESNNEVKTLEKQLRVVEKSINNTMTVIDSGFITDSVKTHLMELEAEKSALQTGIAKAQLRTPTFERDQVIFFLQKFRNGDINDLSWRLYLIETFLKAAYLYDNGDLLLCLNFTGSKNKVTLKIAEDTVNEGEALSSKLASSALPNGANLNTTSMQVYFLAGVVVAKLGSNKKARS